MAKDEKKVSVFLYSPGLRAQYGAKNAEQAVDVPADVAEHVTSTGCGRLAKAGKKKKAEKAVNEPG